MQGRNRLDIDLGAPAGGLKTLKNIAPVEMYTVNYVDGEGKEETRIVFRIRGTKQFYFLFPKGSEESMRKAAPWLQELVEQEVVRFSEGYEKAPIPEEKVKDLPVGDPMS